MNKVVLEKVLDQLLKQNFDRFLKDLKKNLQDNLEIYFYLKFRFYSFVLSNLSLFSIFSHVCFYKKCGDYKKSYEQYCQFYSELYPQIFDYGDFFNDIIIDEWDFTEKFNRFYLKTSFFHLDVCNDPAWIERYKSKVFGCMYFKKIKTAVKFFEFFASILMRV